MRDILILILGLIILAGCNKTVNYNKKVVKYVDFLKDSSKSAEEYILDLFEKK